MESSKETGCQVPEGPILCINNCGFFGSAATMNMCSKCHKDVALQQQASLAASSIENIVNASSSSVNEKEPVLADMVNTEAGAVELKVTFSQSSSELMSSKSSDMKAVEGPKRCTSCRKRVGLTGFSCKCGHLFCSVHRYSDKHDCEFDYRTAAQDAIAKANPLVKVVLIGLWWCVGPNYCKKMGGIIVISLEYIESSVAANWVVISLVCYSV